MSGARLRLHCFPLSAFLRNANTQFPVLSLRLVLLTLHRLGPASPFPLLSAPKMLLSLLFCLSLFVYIDFQRNSRQILLIPSLWRQSPQAAIPIQAERHMPGFHGHLLTPAPKATAISDGEKESQMNPDWPG